MYDRIHTSVGLSNTAGGSDVFWIRAYHSEGGHMLVRIDQRSGMSLYHFFYSYLCLFRYPEEDVQLFETDFPDEGDWPVLRKRTPAPDTASSNT